MHLSPALPFLIAWAFCANAAPSPRSGFARDLYLPVDAIDSGNYSILHQNTTTDRTKLFRVPNTYISLIYEVYPEKRFEFRVLTMIIDDAITQVTTKLENSGNVVLPDDQDPYVDGKFAAPAPKGGWISMQSPDKGPAHGRRLNWGNVRDVLLGLRALMVKQGRGMPFRIDFQVRLDHVGIIGWGEVTPGNLPTSVSVGSGVME